MTRIIKIISYVLSPGLTRSTKRCHLNIQHFYTLISLSDLEIFFIFQRSGIYFGRLKLDSCVNRVKTGRRHFVQESWEKRAGRGPSAEPSCPWGHLAINLWPGSTSPSGVLSVFFTCLTRPLWTNFQHRGHQRKKSKIKIKEILETLKMS